MKKLKRIFKILFLSVTVLLMAIVPLLYILSEVKLKTKYPVADLPDLSFSYDSATIARGEYLSVVANCTMCHGNDLGGAIYYEGMLGTISGPNLTLGEGSVVKDFTSRDWIRAIRNGVHRDQTSLLVMPGEVYSSLSASDLTALIAYLEKLSPVDREVNPTQLKLPARAFLAIGKLPVMVAEKLKDQQPIVMKTPVDAVARGSYLSEIYSCKSCHNKNLSGGRQMGIPGAPKSTNLTPMGLGGWTETDFSRAVRSGIRPDGSVLHDVMPWRNYARMTDEDVHDIWTYLNQLPPLATGSK